MIGTTEILIIGGVVLILFGSAAIPRFFRSIGKAQSEFEKGKREGAADGDAKQDDPAAQRPDANSGGEDAAEDSRQ